MALAAATRWTAEIFLLGVLPALSLAVAIATYYPDTFAYDFHHELYPEAEAVARGDNPFPAADADLADGRNNVWPIAAVIPIIPLTALGSHVADVVATALAIAALLGALAVVGVRDWRVYGAVMLWPPVVNGYQTANLSLPLCLAIAVAWRLRHRVYAPGLAVGAGIAVKLFVWPLLLWLVATRRFRAAAIGTGLAAASMLLLLPFTSIADYVTLIRRLSETFERESYTLFALLVDVGIASEIARIATLVVGVALLVGMWRRRSIGLAVAASIVISPIVWLHFFALMAVPLAIVYRRLAWPWFVPLLLWLVPGTFNGDTWQTALTLGVFAATVLVCEHRAPRPMTRAMSAEAAAPTAS